MQGCAHGGQRTKFTCGGQRRRRALQGHRPHWSFQSSSSQAAETCWGAAGLSWSVLHSPGEGGRCSWKRLPRCAQLGSFQLQGCTVRATRPAWLLLLLVSEGRALRAADRPGLLLLLEGKGAAGHGGA